MPNKLSATKQRISMAEEKELLERLRKYAKQNNMSLTDVYHKAAVDFLTKYATQKKSK